MTRHVRRWSILLCIAAVVAGVAWLRTHHVWIAGAAAAVIVMFGASWVTDHNAVSAYRAVLDKSLETEHSNQATSAYQVRRALTRYRYEPAVEGVADRALTQLKRVHDEFQHFEKSLKEKLNEGELTYERYHSAGLGVFEGALESLRFAASLIGQLQRSGKAALTVELDEIFSANDQAIAHFESINQALEEMRPGGNGVPRLQAAMSELEILAKQAHKYAAIGED